MFIQKFSVSKFLPGEISISSDMQMTLESPLDCKEIQQVHSEGDQSWDLFGRNDAKAETLATSCEELTQ